MDRSPVQQFGPYRIEGVLGRGGMGEVYRAYDQTHDRVVALKLLTESLADDAGYRERFRRESQLAARLREPHVIPIHSFGEIDGRLFLDMRLVEGEDLGEALDRQGPMPPERAVSIISQVARALDAAHDDGLIHRDVKPSNVLLSNPGGDEDFIYLVDFGIARAAGSGGAALTHTGAALGSFDYMAPERFLDAGIDRRTDVYSLACLLYECLMASRPFKGDGLPTLMYAHLNLAPPRPSTQRPGIPYGLDEVIATGMAKNPDRRYARAGDLGAAARAALASHRSAPAGPAGPGSAAGWAPPHPAAGPRPGSGGGPSQPGPPGMPGQLHTPPRPWSGPVAPGGGSPSGPHVGTPSGPQGFFGPPARRPPKSRRGLLLGAAAVAALLVVLAVTLIVILNTGDQPNTSADPTTSTASPTPTDELPAGGILDGAGGSGPDERAGPAEPTDESALRDLIPLDFSADNCTPTGRPADDGSLAALTCGASITSPGANASDFLLYDDAGDLTAAFEAYVQERSLEALPSSDAAACGEDEGYGQYSQGGPVLGSLACFIDSENTAYLVWTNEELKVFAITSAASGDAVGLRAIYDWWITRGQITRR
ncbi:MAG: serine/threonine protein kinase [Actinomycetota bacterium]|nr:serine/threonine protein kinase [Actinomycetota bacterium]